MKGQCLEERGRDIHGEGITENVVHIVVGMRCVHNHKLHVFRRLPVPFPLVDEPVVYLLLVQTCGLS